MRKGLPVLFAVRVKASVAAVVFSWATGSLAQTAAPTQPPAFRLEVHGFTTGSVYAQDASLNLGGGQGALWVNPQSPTAPAPKEDRLVLGGDVRQTRFNFSVVGPQVFDGATPKALLEIDFFGNFGSGPYGNVSLSPRMRLAYAELNWGATRIQFGQNNDLIIAMIPVSLAHIAYPVSYGSGSVGWRRVAVWGYHTFGDIKDKDATKVEFAWEVGRSQWNDSGAVGTATCSAAAPCVGNGIGQSSVGASGDVYGNSLGAASGLPAVEARLSLLGGQTYSAWIAGHYNKVDRSGQGASPTTSATGISSDLDVIVGNVGAKVVAGPLTVLGSAFVGKNTAPLVGSFIQFSGRGDVHEWGAWIQAGYNFTKELSLWGYIGSEQLNRNEGLAASFKVLGETTSGALLQYRDGGYAVGAEWFHFRTATVAPVAGLDTTLNGNQLLLSGNYFF